MDTWWEYPQKIKNWGSNIDYVMFVDENNSVDKQQVIYKKLINKVPITIDEKYFQKKRTTNAVLNRTLYNVPRSIRFHD